MESFFKTAEILVKLSPESKLALSKILKKHVLPKGHIIVSGFCVSNRIFFIEKGLSRTFYLKNNKDITDWFSSEGQFAASVLSFLTRKPDRRSIELLEDSVLWSLDYSDLENTCSKYHEIEHLVRVLLANGVIMIQQRFDDLHFATAKERYSKLLETNAGIINRASLGNIASYLGITQETLSRIRAAL